MTDAKREPRVLIYDIETSLQAVAVFGLAHNDWIQPENIITERHVISVCWKWFGEKKVHSVSLLDDPKRFARDIHDDEYVLRTFHEVMKEADVLIHHNGDSFDSKYLATRMLKHGLDPLPPVTTIDTYKVAKAKFMFNSNKLDYIGRFLGLGGKASTPKGLWLKVLAGCKKSIQIMVGYNKRDVVLLEDVFLKLRPYIPNHISRELFGNEGCPRCGCKKVQSRGYSYAITRVYRRFQCMGCRGWFRKLRAEEGTTTQHRVI